MIRNIEWTVGDHLEEIFSVFELLSPEADISLMMVSDFRKR